MFKLGPELEKETGLTNIDVRLLNDAPLAASGRILTEGRSLYSGDDSARVDFEVRIRGLYFRFPAASELPAAGVYPQDCRERAVVVNPEKIASDCLRGPAHAL
ncbi:MAG: hypothetical protein M1423_03550 [Acidobacteria bacterium]|nr:hypothetical protein [Acidobacteriota bacterium]